MTGDAPDLKSFIRPGDVVLWGQACAEPLTLTDLLRRSLSDIGPVRCFAGLGLDVGHEAPLSGAVTTVSYTGIGHRAADRDGTLEILPWHYSEIERAIMSRRYPVDVLLVQVTRAGPDGFHRLALAADYVAAALATARVVVAEVNSCAPYVHYAPVVPPERVTAWVEASYAPREAPAAEVGDVERKIGAHVAGLVDDGATLQMGLGKIPEAALACLADRRDLGIHSGTIGDAVASLIASGAVTNARKGRDAGVTTTGLVMGTRAIFDLVDDDDSFALRPISYTHDPDVLATLPHLVTINSAIEVDLTGQVNCEVAGGRYVGALGGALDFLLGAHRSHGGVPVIALPSTAGSRSRIVERLSGPATIPRAWAPVVVTEHGIADLRGLTLGDRRERLLAVADPAHVSALSRTVPPPGTRHQENS